MICIVSFCRRRSRGVFRCSVYDTRFEKAPWCATVDEALEQGLLAQDCPYTSESRGYRGKTRLHARLMTKVEPGIRQSLLRDGGPLGLDVDGALRFLERTGGGEFDIIEDEVVGRMWFRQKRTTPNAHRPCAVLERLRCLVVSNRWMCFVLPVVSRPRCGWSFSRPSDSWLSNATAKSVVAHCT